MAKDEHMVREEQEHRDQDLREQNEGLVASYVYRFVISMYFGTYSLYIFSND